MSNDDEMTIDERRKYLRKMQKRYREAMRKERSKLLDEMQTITKLHRKSLLRLINGKLSRKKRTKQRSRTYGFEVQRALKIISESIDYLCAERLQPNLVWMAKHLAAHGELEISSHLLKQLQKVSVSTIRRILKQLGQDQPRLPRKGPEEANRFRRNVPAKRIPWNEQEPGHFEVDLVLHCGVSASGQYVHTLQMIDVATGWSERVATLGREAIWSFKMALNASWPVCPFPSSKSILTTTVPSSTLILRSSGKMPSKTWNNHAAERTRRMTTASSNRRTAPSCGHTSDINDLTP